MHEFALYGQVAKDSHHQTLQQLAGFTRMQPVDTLEIHLVFKARQPAGLDRLPSGGGSQGVLQPEIQRYRNMLNASLYYVQLVGEVSPASAKSQKHVKSTDKDVVMSDATNKEDVTVQWSLEFKDTPDAGKQAVSTRLISRVPLSQGNLAEFLDHFGYDYVSRYLLVGSKFYDHDTTLHVHKILTLPPVSASAAITERSYLSNVSELKELDGSGSYLVQASIDVIDGNNQELKDRATRQLLNLQESLKAAFDLTPADRLALDTRLPSVVRRV
ncbi:hypothetical protein B0A52_02301 [Exophiala mesophila]|uniref:Mediator of RNA polymerase II transcription subunit 18 n=1 Tax=Exophiala mesophila TaxID=212818 RepID=A0A438NBL7_EXOME|nr:hypothetical protein B0A52_02301 [Exophiala mesophila]